MTTKNKENKDINNEDIIPSLGGRPSKYNPDFCEQLIEHMGKGYSYESFAGVIEVAKDTIYQWEKKHLEFSYAKKIGKSKQHKKLEEIGMTGMTQKGFNYVVWIFWMKNCCNWQDKVEISSDMSVTVKVAKDEENL